MKRLLILLLLLLLLISIRLAGPAHAEDYRFVGPWFTTVTLNTANGQPSLVAGQNNDQLGITFTCFDSRLTLGIWQPNGSLDLGVARRTRAEIQVDGYEPIAMTGIGTARNLAEFDGPVALIMREMLTGRQASLAFTPDRGRTRRELFRLDNANIAFADIRANCPL